MMHCSTDPAVKPIQTCEQKGRVFTYRPDIDGLRALAVTAVVAYHMNSAWLPGGFVGVDIFFVISGYVVTSSLDGREKEQDGEGGGLSWDVFTDFYSRRLKRLLPASLAMVCMAGFFIALLIPPWAGYIDRYYTSGMFGIVGISNIFYSTLEINYFDTKADGGQDMNPFLHTWSLGVEEQFYLITPLLSLLSSCVASKVGNPHLNSVILLSTAALCSMALSWRLSSTGSTAAFYLLPSRFWELAAGVLLCKFGAFQSEILGDTVIQSAKAIMLQVVAVLLIGASLLLTPSAVGFPFPFALPAVCGAMCFIASGEGAYLNTILSQSSVVLLGRASYSLYLFHWPVIVFFRWTMGLESWAVRVACLLSFTLLTTFSYTCIEKPTRYWRTNKQTIFAVMLAAVCVSEMWIHLLRSSTESIYLAPDFLPQPTTLSMSQKIPDMLCGASQQMYVCRANIPTLYTACGAQKEIGAMQNGKGEERGGGEATHHSPECLPQFGRQQMQEKSYAYQDSPCVIWNDERQLDSPKIKNAGQCLEDSASRSKNAIFLIGDSHAAHHIFGFNSVFSQHFLLRHFIALGYGYRPSSPDPFDQLFAAQVDHALMVTLRPGDIVVHSRISEYVDDSQWIVYEHDLLSLGRRVSAKGASLLLLGDIPANPKHATLEACTPTYFNRTAMLGCEIPLSAVRDKFATGNQMYSELAKNNSGIYFFDPSHLFCDSITCGAFVPGTTVAAKIDENHMTASASVYLAHFVADFLNEQNLLNLAEHHESTLQVAGALQVSAEHAHRVPKRLRRFKGSNLLQTACSEETCSAVPTAYNCTST